MKYVVIGGGIAGTCCSEEICRLIKSDDLVVLISAASVLKVASQAPHIKIIKKSVPLSKPSLAIDESTLIVKRIRCRGSATQPE